MRSFHALSAMTAYKPSQANLETRGKLFECCMNFRLSGIRHGTLAVCLAHGRWMIRGFKHHTTNLTFR